MDLEAASSRLTQIAETRLAYGDEDAPWRAYAEVLVIVAQFNRDFEPQELQAGVVERLKEFIEDVHKALEKVAGALKGATISVGASTPFTLSVSLTFSPSAG